MAADAAWAHGTVIDTAGAVLAQGGLSWGTLGVAAAMTLVAATLRGITGFGMAIMLVPLLAMILPPDRAVVLAILMQLLLGPLGYRAMRASADWQSARTIALWAVLATPAGLATLVATPVDAARVLIALVAVSAFLLVLSPPTRAGAPSARVTAATGLASGFLSGFAAMPGPPVVPYYLSQPLPPAVARASMMLVFALTAITGTVAAWWLGRLDRAAMIGAALLFVPMWLGNTLGSMAFGRIPPLVWRSIVALLLGVAALSAIIRAW